MSFKYQCQRAAALILAAVVAGGTLLSAFSIQTEAAIKDATVFQDVDWQYMGESPVISDTGWLQSMCSTKDYIICLENSSTKDSSPDTFLAFYKNDVDENGNPVEKYSLAKQVTETDYEHANGMTYNPKTNEILVVGATPLKEENRGLVYIVDADTLKLKRTVRLSHTYNLLGIAYSEDTDQYVVQFFNVGYTTSFFMVLDRDFRQVGDIFYAKMWNNIRHQDFCISGDYLISLAFTNKVSNSNVMHIYSVSTGELLVSYDLDITQNGEFIEPESICELGPGEILIGNAMKNPNRISFYKTSVAAAFKLSTSVENGTITGSQKTVDYGSDYTVNYEPNENFEMDTITIDGQAIDPAEYPDSYVFNSVSQNHTIDVKFKEKPKFNITTSVQNGFIDASVVKHRDNDCTIVYGPNKHYEISEVIVDGVRIPAQTAAESYTFKNIQDNHEIRVEFTEIPTYEVDTAVKNGTISTPDEKLYRDDDYTVYYRPDDGYQLAWVEIDGVRTYAFEMTDDWNDYTFKEMQRSHTISVVYYWKYLTWLIISIGLLLVIFFITLICLCTGYSRRRKMRRRYKKRKKIKKRAAKNRKKAEDAVKARMQCENRIDDANKEDSNEATDESL